MNFQVTQSWFNAAISIVMSIVDRKSTSPILQNILIIADEQGCSVTSTNLDIEIKHRTDDIICDIPISFVVNAETLANVINRLPNDSTITLTSDGEGKEILLQVNKIKVALPILPADDYPKFQEIDGANGFDVSSEILFEILNKTLFSVSTEETRYYLCGVYLHVADSPLGDQLLTAVATDGIGLARARASVAGVKDIHPAIIPPKTASAILKTIKEGGAKLVTLLISESKCCLEAGNTRILSKLIDATYPDYQRLIVEDMPNQWAFHPSELSQAISLATSVSSGKSISTAVNIDLSDEAFISRRDRDMGQCSQTVGAERLLGEDVKTALSGKYATDILSRLTNEVVISIDAVDSPVHIVERQSSGDVHCDFVLMPIRRAKCDEVTI